MKDIIYLYLFIKVITSQDISSLTDLKTLSELPLDKLLKLKNNFDFGDNYGDAGNHAVKIGNSEALPLQSKFKPFNRGGYDMEYFKNKLYHKKDVNTIFQLSVTTLAFIAFGGYLLCLIVQAIKLKYNNANATNTMVAMLVRPNKLTAVNKPTRNTKPGSRPRPENSRYKREVWPEADPNKMYEALIFLAEGYTKFNTVEYSHLNNTM